MSNDTNAGIIHSGIEEELKKTGRLIYHNVGDSMLPLIREGKDLLIIERPKEWDELTSDSATDKLHRLDIPLYRRDDSKVYVLHRVLAVKKDGYVICGDNRRNREFGITDRHVVGVLTGIVRDGKEITLSGIGYRFYSHLWCDMFFIRAGIILLRDMIMRVLR
ncbi:MAG: S24/S26 family peptidase [Lachnospiraceae bacterium]|nr:S24/S26 family peptidase [Lachnospiraceae bacterium]